MGKSILKINQLARISSIVVLLAALALRPPVVARAQRAKDAPVNIIEIHARPTRSGTVVTVSADGPLNRAQTWQDGEGLHLMLPDGGQIPIKNVPSQMKVRQVGKWKELVVPVKPGSNVTVEPLFNRLNLIINGSLDPAQIAPDDKPSRQTQRTKAGGEASNLDPLALRSSRQRQSTTELASTALPVSSQPARSTSTLASSNTPPVTSAATSATPEVPAETAQAKASPNDATPANTSAQLVPISEDGAPPADSAAATVQDPEAPPAQIQAPAKRGIFSYIFSATGVLAFLALGMIALFVIRRRRSTQELSAEAEGEEKTTALATVPMSTPDNLEELFERRKNERRRSGRRDSDKEAMSRVSAAHDGSSPEKSLEMRSLVHVPATLFGAYRVDQEVGKLLLGQAHRMDVLASRAPDDRRAIETYLLKAISSPDSGEDERRRARQALEEYGFVARQCAALLMAQDAYERSSAARTLGEIGSRETLPFLIEALYDPESIVRTQAVVSLGALKLPSAIGALLDLARRHPEMPSALISRALNACSIECSEMFGTFMPDETPLSIGAGGPFTGEIMQLEPIPTVEELPAWLEDENLAEALERLESADVEARTAAARSLAQYQVQSSVAALAAIATHDQEPVVRAAAVTSLGAINHESVFAPVLIALADEAKEVTAAAARALNRLNIDRADAYVRLLETADPETLRNVARACIKAGMASKAMDRLASEDRRQAYEAFSLLSMLAKSNETEEILEAIENHQDINVRQSAIRLLGLAGQPEVVQQLRHLAVRDGLPEKIRTALLEVVYKIDQAQPA
ncbi:MAG TPA: HEAT repeat domain-containing protein [Pyrinomonadaceae bacterium]|nr:HEAT repeat domain-containing protein [Pyrinomonadaceae bacterium]